MSLSYSFGRHRPKPRRVMQVRSCGGPGVRPPTFWPWGCKCGRTPYAWSIVSVPSVLPTVAELRMHADFCTWYIVHETSMWISWDCFSHCINRIRMFGSGWAGSAQTPGESTRGKGRKEDWRRERAGWPHTWTPKISDRSPPLHVGYTVARRQNKQASKASFCIGLKV